MFDLSSVKSSEEKDRPLPDGQYTVVCSDAVLKDNKAGTGSYIMATFTVKTGPEKGEQLKEFFNVENTNPIAVRIGRESMKNFFENSSYAGDYKFETPNDACIEMFGLIVGIETKVKPSQDPAYAPRASVKKYMKISAGVSGATPAGPSTDAPASGEIPF